MPPHGPTNEPTKASPESASHVHYSRIWVRTVAGEGCYVYSLDTVEGDSAAYARFFNPTMGIVEDAATGTAAGPLIAKLVAEGRVARGVSAVVEQGHTLGRPSRILITVDGDAVSISGAGLIVASGTVLV